MRTALALVLLSVLGPACSASVGTPSDKDAEQPNVVAPAVESEPPAAAPEVEPQPQPEPEPEPEPEPGLHASLTLPDDVPPLDTPCETRRGFAQKRVAAALSFASGGCTTDAQCVQARKGTGCRGACSASVLETHADAYESFRSSLDERVCSTYRDDKCPYATPRCINGAPRCVEGRCEWAQP